ncbi:MAG: toll/interleukin-1 receptor domain-containing protein, partial [Acidobacteriota bacterium]
AAPAPVIIPKPVIEPRPTVRPKPSPSGEILYRIVVPTPTPRLFHQEEVEGDYPGLLEKGATERIRIRLIRKLVESPRQIEETVTAGDRTQLTESIAPVPGRPLDIALEESRGAGYDAWVRCRLASESLQLTPADAASADWRPLGGELRVDWEWLVRTTSPVLQQRIEAVMEIEWRPKGPDSKRSRTVSHQLWQENLVVTVADPLLKSGQVEVVSPLLGGSGALLMLIAALPLRRRRRDEGKANPPETGAPPRFDVKRAAPPAPPPSWPPSAPAANLDPAIEQQQDVVECSVFAPPLAPQGETVMIQVFAHLEGRDGEAARLAASFDPTATTRGVKTLSSRVARGAELTFHLTLSRLEIAEPIQTLVWMGDTESVQFIVDVPTDCRLGNLAGSVTISLETVPIGRISFLLRVVPSGTAVPDAAEAIEASAHAFRYTFISYASEDRDKVLARVQMLDQMGIRYFQDLLSLDPGQRWEKELYRNIDQCDLFLLFWSNAAKRSEWVMREVDYAIDRKGGNDDSPPEIRPVIIEGPPLVTPPEKLKHLQFNDRLIYLMSRNEEK